MAWFILIIIVITIVGYANKLPSISSRTDLNRGSINIDKGLDLFIFCKISVYIHNQMLISSDLH